MNRGDKEEGSEEEEEVGIGPWLMGVHMRIETGKLGSKEIVGEVETGCVLSLKGNWDSANTTCLEINIIPEELIHL